MQKLNFNYGLNRYSHDIREMPPWRRVGGPCISMSSSWPDDERVEASTIRRNALNRRHQRALDSCTSVVA